MRTSASDPGSFRDEILPLIEEIGRQKNVLVIDLFTPLLDHLNLFPDGIHPNAQGAQIIAQTLLPYFTSMRFVRDFNQDGVVNWTRFCDPCTAVGRDGDFSWTSPRLQGMGW